MHSHPEYNVDTVDSHDLWSPQSQCSTHYAGGSQFYSQHEDHIAQQKSYRQVEVDKVMNSRKQLLPEKQNLSIHNS